MALSDELTNFRPTKHFCQLGVLTDTIFKKRYPLDLRANSNFTLQKLISSDEITEKSPRMKQFECLTLVNWTMAIET